MISGSEIGENIQKYRHLYESGQMTNEEALEAVRPYVEAYNKKAKEIANKYGMKPKLIPTKGSHWHMKWIGIA